MDYLRYVGGGGAKPSGVTMGCKYRQRTGACCCDNPPIGCLEPEERRARAATKSPDGAAPPRPPAAAAPPLPLPAAFAIHRREVKVCMAQGEVPPNRALMHPAAPSCAMSIPLTAMEQLTVLNRSSLAIKLHSVNGFSDYCIIIS